MSSETIRAPIGPETSRDAELPAAPHILIIEDSPTQAAKLQAIFEDQGWTAAAVAAVEAAWVELRRRRPALIVVDFHLPGMRGDEFCRRAKMNAHTRDIPILMLTVEDADATETLGLAAGADDYVSKAVDPDILLVRVRSLLRKPGAGAALPSASPELLRNPRILMIDDSATYRAYLADVLSMDDFEVIEAGCGAEGLTLLGHKASTACSSTWSCRSSMASRSAAGSRNCASPGVQDPWF